VGGDAVRLLGAVLAGGASTRLGPDKALIALPTPAGPRPMAAVAAALLREAGAGRVVVVTPRPAPLSGLADGVVLDLYPGRGPLGGIHAALSAARGAWCLVLACDMPLAGSGFLAAMAARVRAAGAGAAGAGAAGAGAAGADPGFDALVPRTAAGLEPLCALYGPACLGAARRILAAPGRVPAATALLGTVRAAFVDEAEIARWGDPRVLFFNVNDAQDLGRARAILGAVQEDRNPQVRRAAR